MHQLTIGPYKNLEIKGPEMFKESDVEKAVVESVITAANNWAKANLPIERGDKITVQVEATLDGLTVPEVCNSALTYAVGDPSMVPEFETALGKKLGDTFIMDITFGSQAPIERIANKTVHFDVQIKDVVHVMPPNIDDALVQQLDSNIKTLDELKDRFRIIIRENGLENLRDQKVQMVLENIIKSSACTYDEADFQALFDRILMQTKAMLVNTPVPNLQKGLDDESFHADCRELTERTIKEELIIQTVSEKEGIIITDEEFEANKEKFTQTPQELEEFNKYFPTDEAFRHFLLKEKVVDQLVEWNIV